MPNKSKKQERIIADCYCKKGPRRFDDDVNDPFNKRVAAVNAMYGWLYDQGILTKKAFEVRDYSDATYFAIDVSTLVPYRKAMEESGVPDADIAVQNIFDEVYTPCLYSGAIELSWTMQTYREFSGTVERSWECEYIRDLNSCAVLDIEKIKKKKGIKAAISEAFRLLEFEPSDM